MATLVSHEHLQVVSATSAGVAPSDHLVDFADVAGALEAAAGAPDDAHLRLVVGLHARAVARMWSRLGHEPITAAPSRSPESDALMAAAALASGPMFSSRRRYDHTRLATVLAYLLRFSQRPQRTVPSAALEERLLDISPTLTPLDREAGKAAWELRPQTVAAVSDYTLKVVLGAPEGTAAVAGIDLGRFGIGSFESATALLRCLMADFAADVAWSRAATARAAADLVRACRATEPSLMF